VKLYIRICDSGHMSTNCTKLKRKQTNGLLHYFVIPSRSIFPAGAVYFLEQNGVQYTIDEYGGMTLAAIAEKKQKCL
jgi:hypothetical protein